MPVSEDNHIKDCGGHSTVTAHRLDDPLVKLIAELIDLREQPATLTRCWRTRTRSVLLRVV
jgi:hypothetical protein